jgi:hypothetical protein
MGALVAPRHTYGELDADVLVESGETIRVFDVSCYNGTGQAAKFQLQYADGSANYADIGVPSGQTVIYDIQFLADFGLKVLSLGTANASVSIFHSHGGS